MEILPEPVQKLINEFKKMPGIGSRTAKKLTFHLLNQNEEEINQFIQALEGIKSKIKLCEICCNFTTEDKCPICSDDKRNKNIICVVEKPSDATIIENTHEYKGTYHILHGSINPLEGITPDDLKIQELVKRVVENKNNIEEIIIATNPNTEGNTTALYLKSLLEPFKIKITRIAQGLSAGSELEYADEVSVLRSLEGRTDF